MGKEHPSLVDKGLQVDATLYECTLDGNEDSHMCSARKPEVSSKCEKWQKMV